MTNNRTILRQQVLRMMLTALACAGIAAGPALGQGWKPERAVEIVVPSSPGGSNDRTARTIANIWHAKRIVPTSTVVNKPGGGGTIARVYLNQHAGDAHYIGVESINLLTDHITGKTPLSYVDFTPVALLYTEYVAFVVKTDSPIRAGKDLVEALKRKPDALAMGISSTLGAANHLGIAMVAKTAGVDVRKLRNVVFGSGGESTTALLGGHIDVVPTSASNVTGLLKAGQVRIVAVSSSRRLGGALSAVPTWKEQGVDVVFGIRRILLGPKGLTQPQIAYWDDVFARLSETEEWKKDLEANFWESSYANSESSRKELAAQNEELKAVLADLGLAK
jgi:putative tricarboxylic transport membrane protein